MDDSLSETHLFDFLSVVLGTEFANSLGLKKIMTNDRSSFLNSFFAQNHVLTPFESFGLPLNSKISSRKALKFFEIRLNILLTPSLSKNRLKNGFAIRQTIFDFLIC